MMDLSVVPYGETGRSKGDVSGGGEHAGGRYRECMRNHAAAIGGQAYDGCGEFMPAGEGGSPEALKCAACGCHRNFHRREGFSADPRRPLLLYNAAAWDGKKPAPPPPTPPPGFPAFLPPPHAMPLPFHQIHPPPPPQAYQQGFDRSRVGSETPPRREEAGEGGDGARSAMRKRYRTKFTPEQKEKMQAFAEKLGWRIQKHDDVALQEFCVEIGVKRHVLKVWMHNNKNSLSSSSSAVTASASNTDHAASAPPISV